MLRTGTALSFLMHRRLLPGLLAALMMAPGTVRAQVQPTQVVEKLHGALLDVMREASRVGTRGRFERLRPVMESSFDLAAMTRIAVGPGWTSVPSDTQADLSRAFSDWSIATYASRFNGFAGESFTTEGESTLRNGDRMVRTLLNRPGQDPVRLGYLLRQRGGQWCIVDVYLSGSISELASRRADFASILSDGGAGRLIGELRRRTAELLRS
ncbi:ABC transporter substrate-binding protein [Pseudoroseomonas globiformis]|uniref:ABC transporter substrate-binding protein n=1 Tax=Teichococcus globiformis TaxID=2307229 RepID=A0ABV7FTD7_9PROT